FQRVPLINRQQHVGIAKNPFRFTVFEYGDGEFKELNYLKKIHSLSGIRTPVYLSKAVTVAGTVVKTAKVTKKPAQKVGKAVKTEKSTEGKSTKKTTTNTTAVEKKVETPVKAKIYPKEYYQKTSITKISEIIEDGDKYIIHQVLEDYFCIEIGDDVSDMKSFAFVNCHNLRELYFTGSGIRRISGVWFSGKKNLSIVEFCEGIKEIGYGAFQKTSLCGTVRLPDSLEQIDGKAFAVLEPETLTVSISENTKYESDSFHPATKIIVRKAVKPKKAKEEEKPAVKVETPKVEKPKAEEKKAPIKKAKPVAKEEPPKPYTDFSVEDDFELREWDWGDCQISYIVNEHEVMTIPDKVTHINADTFEICDAEKIRKLVLPAKLQYIEDKALYPLVNLEEVVFKDHPKDCKFLYGLYTKILGKCKVRHIQLPEQYLTVATGAFSDCETLETLSVGFYCLVQKDAVPKTCKVICREKD
ncbi:MAG: leucine-rich repeat protein, partial [Clostridia bacterium]|nr:leucine-rich repeat protein [Clostridia bacterium]